MPSLGGTKTHENLKHAFAGESQANRRYLYFARQADVEGYPDIAGLFRDTAEGETGHAHGHLDFLKEVGDPYTGEPIGGTPLNLRLRSRAKLMSTPRCIPASLAQPAKRDSKRSPSGSKHSRAPRNLTRAGSKRDSIPWVE